MIPQTEDQRWKIAQVPIQTDDQRVVGTAPQRQAQASALPLHGDLRQLRGHTKAVLGNCCATRKGKLKKKKTKSLWLLTSIFI